MKNWMIVILLLLIGAAAYYYFTVRESGQAVSEQAVAVQAPLPRSEPEPEPEPPTSLKDPAEPWPPLDAPPPPVVEEIPLPMLHDSDPLVLETLAGLIGQPAVSRYLVTDNVISRVVATVDTMGSARIPGVVQAVQGPGDEFRATANDSPDEVILSAEGDELPQFVINPANYERYTAYVALLEAADPDSLVGSYRQNYPLFQEAYRQMGYADGDFDARLVEVIDELLATPEVPDPVGLVKPEAFYVFTDPDLESLSAGQKILLRMGSRNAARVKAKLTEIRAAL